MSFLKIVKMNFKSKLDGKGSGKLRKSAAFYYDAALFIWEYILI